MPNSHDIADCITENLNQYFRDLNGEPPSNVYDMVLFQVEKPLLKRVMDECSGNQCRAAEVLGMNRNTLCSTACSPLEMHGRICNFRGKQTRQMQARPNYCAGNRVQAALGAFLASPIFHRP